jgi:hypothetical protein
MSTPSQQDVGQIRAQVTDLAVRAKTDSAFMQQLKADPRGALVAAGLPAGAVDDVLHEEGVSDVTGYLSCSFTCVFSTTKCVITVLL